MNRFYFIILNFLSVLFIFSCNNKTEKAEKIKITTPLIAYAKVDKTTATIGDKITFTLTVDKNPEVKEIIPDLKSSLSDFEIISEKKSSAFNVDNRIIKNISMVLQAQENGSYIIEPIIIRYKENNKSGQVKTSKIYIEIKSVLSPEEKTQDIQDIKDIEKFDYFNPYFIYIIILIVLLLMVGLFFLIKKMKEKNKIFLPHETALKELADLENKKLIENDIKSFYFEISEITRKYLKIGLRYQLWKVHRKRPKKYLK
jgi:hypothetical protein